MRATVALLAGLPDLPSTERGVRIWLRRHNVPLDRDGKRFVFSASDLPEDVQIKLQLRAAEASGLAIGVQDDAAWAAHLAKPAGVQAMAGERVALVAQAVKLRAQGLTWPKVMAQLRSSFASCPEEQTLQRWLKRVENVDPANWAPALAPDYGTAGAPLSACTPAAWSYFEARIAASGRNGTGANFKAQWAATRAEADRQGWVFPKYRTALRRWERLSVERQRTLEKGVDATVRSLTHFLPRSLEGMRAMEQVEVDFREFKVLCTWEDGTVGCPWVGLAVDRASSKIVGRSVAQSENTEGVVSLIRDTVESHWIPDRLVQDNGAAFNSRRMMGGKTPLVRRKDKGERSPDWAVPGVYEHLKIEVTNHGPRMAWAKLPESINSVLRHVDNDPAFYRAQRSGPMDAPNPDAVPVPIALFRAVLDRAIADVNSNTESRAKGLRKGESRNAAFRRLAEGVVAREPSPLQRRWMRLSWHRLKVLASGQVRIGPRYWGDASTQRAMLHYADQWVVIGIEADNPHAAAMVYEWNDTSRTGRMLLEKLPAMIEAQHDDTASKHRAQTEKRRAKNAAKAEEIPGLDAFVASERARIMAEMGQADPTVLATAKVTQLTVGGPFSAAPARHAPAELTPKQKTDLFFALKAEGDRVASGVNR